MANRDNPNGLRPVRVKYGTAPEVTEGFVATGNTVYEGQIVVRTGTAGELKPYNDTDVLAGNIAGVAAHYLASVTGRENKKLLYYSDPEQRYVIQSDDDSLNTRDDYMDKLFPLTNATTGNTTTLQSKAELDGSAGADTISSTASIATVAHCLELYGGIDNTSNASWTRYLERGS
jgi:hypothetical protein